MTSSADRRTVLGGLVGGAALAALGVAPGRASEGYASGLPWATGVYNNHSRDHRPEYEEVTEWLDRRCDVFDVYYRKRRWSDLEDAAELNTAKVRELSELGLTCSCAVPLLPDNAERDYEQGLDPETDRYYLAMIKSWKASGVKNLLFRPGWEFNISAGIPWSITKREHIPLFVELYRKVSDMLRNDFPDATLIWNPGKNTVRAIRSIDDCWPGDEYVDVIGLDYYDNGFPEDRFCLTEEDWEATAGAGSAEKPAGILSWREYARGRGKPFAVPEWGITNRPDNPEPNGITDRPLFITKMHEFFRDTARDGSLHHECYFNIKRHQIWPPNAHPETAAEYRRLFQPAPSRI